MSSPVEYDVQAGVATITLDHQATRNALSKALVAGVFDGVDRAEADDDVRVVVVRAAGSVFCSGADLSEATGEGMEEGARTIVELQRRIVASPKPFVARVHGAVRAGGIGIVAACDIAVAADSATFALTEVRLGLAASVISLTVLPRMTPRSASRTLLTGEKFDGAAAADMGLVTVAVPEAELDAELDRVVGDLLKGHPQGLAEGKKLLNADLLAGLEARGEERAALSARLFGSDAAREAMLAFLSKGR
ncbi:enoyl-CoA hydratase family protein [Nocardioides sp. HDW12B]|uniref:enoyl-CoA hydratase family protein n=1 Tax=Nocardioides sp. HDW12B TaxID=2714939 RepID=UPI001409244F|nr:enoyl-CoA hydratase family protein [Nocardioides sp. HDW12B]QIK67786.1 enoyl-CoA hydratase family protein [Nocardioides sp. HDW12B]